MLRLILHSLMARKGKWGERGKLIVVDDIEKVLCMYLYHVSPLTPKGGYEGTIFMEFGP